ncbi:MAG: RNA-binding protein [Verrucomicrobia bacterium]|nr:RNA-binding protein [Verrucomicrobiota bacterium]MBV8970048.1 RNA-binding protein [Verrucomicrobiota bacterium]
MKLFVGNLSFATTETDLEDLFAAYGTVTDVGIVMDRTTGRSRGFGFVTMSNAAEAQAAIEALEGKEFGGRNLNVNEARPKTDSRPSGGGGGDRRGRPSGGGDRRGRSFDRSGR